jgi:hypothetical protein
MFVLTFAQVKAVPGVQSVQRVVCGGCHDFKVTPFLLSLDDDSSRDCK